jgi:hypothetical protein
MPKARANSSLLGRIENELDLHYIATHLSLGTVAQDLPAVGRLKIKAVWSSPRVSEKSKRGTTPLLA